MTKASAARRAAYEALMLVRTRAAFVRDILPRILTRYHLSESDRAFATRLAIGCVQTQGTLDEVLDRAMRTPRDAKPRVRDALRVSTYEMLFLDKDHYAAVDQGVELVGWVAPKARGLANAVLRKVACLAEDFPFGDPQADIVAAARAYGFPVWLAQRLEMWLGPVRARRFMEVSNEQPPVFACINALRASEKDVAVALEAAGIGFARLEGIAVPRAGSEDAEEDRRVLVSHPFGERGADFASVDGDGFAPTPGCIKLEDPAAVAHPVFAELIASGAVIVADAAAQAVAALAADHAQTSLLDACAGRGTKALLIQSDAMRRCGRQVEHLCTLDAVASKQAPLEDHARACGAHISAMLIGDATDLSASLGDELFDTVLVDAPCTGLGTLRRHPEIRWRITPDELEAAAELDSRLLESAAAQVAPGGTLVYATCTIAPAENVCAIEQFLASRCGASYQLQPIAGAPLFAPPLTSGGCDAHFCAVMTKRV